MPLESPRRPFSVLAGFPLGFCTSHALEPLVRLWGPIDFSAAPPALGEATPRSRKEIGNELLFSAASLWEIAIKRGLGREDFRVDVRLLRRGLLDNGYGELPVGSEHAVAIDGLPPIHKDLFDRLLVAQALVEGVTLLTSDELVAQ